MFLAQMESVDKKESIASNPRERHEERTERRKGGEKGGKRRIPAARAVLKATVTNSRKSRKKGRRNYRTLAAKKILKTFIPVISANTYRMRNKPSSTGDMKENRSAEGVDCVQHARRSVVHKTPGTS